MTTNRSAAVTRKTTETDVSVLVTLDAGGAATVSTGLGFLDHMLGALAKHSRMDLNVRCQGDLEVDDHHSVEDCALAIGQAIDQALGDRRGIARFGSAYAPLDESLCRCVLDLSGRPFAAVDLGFKRDRLGDISTENIEHFFASLATAARCTLHIELLQGENDHHKAEAAFKATALALRQAIALDLSTDDIPSTKGLLL